MNTPGFRIPQQTQDLLESLREDTGVAPTVELINPTTILLTHENERVRMTVRYVRKIGSKRWHWGVSELYENGAKRKNALTYQHYVAIFEGREEAHKSRKVTELAPLDPHPPGVAIPLGVQKAYDDIKKRMAREDKRNITVGMDGERYVIEIAGPLATVRLNYVVKGVTESAARLFREDPQDPLRVVLASGVDITDEVIANADLFQSLMMGDTSAIPDLTDSPTTMTRGPRSNAVETRRATVIRV